MSASASTTFLCSQIYDGGTCAAVGPLLPFHPLVVLLRLPSAMVPLNSPNGIITLCQRGPLVPFYAIKGWSGGHLPLPLLPSRPLATSFLIRLHPPIRPFLSIENVALLGLLEVLLPFNTRNVMVVLCMPQTLLPFHSVRNMTVMRLPLPVLIPLPLATRKVLRVPTPLPLFLPRRTILLSRVIPRLRTFHTPKDIP